ncbi:MAG: transcriptional regulator NrdR [Parcubacteria group bacterium]
MMCLSCAHKDTKVTDSRVVNEGMAIRRRRECPKCEFRFSTYEEVEILNLMVVKRDGGREPYSREKMERGIKKALEKRPITQEAFRMLSAHIERDVQSKARADEITSKDIGEVIMHHLKSTDKVAYIRFASVYKSFEDIDSFKQEIKKIT